MEKHITSLFAYQKEALLAALHRDMQCELGKALSEPQWADYHRLNARMLNSILEVLNPIASGEAAPFDGTRI
jgi:hypothetical protein